MEGAGVQKVAFTKDGSVPDWPLGKSFRGEEELGYIPAVFCEECGSD